VAQALSKSNSYTNKNAIDSKPNQSTLISDKFFSFFVKELRLLGQLHIQGVAMPDRVDNTKKEQCILYVIGQIPHGL
jgi:hypothetical protein